MYYDPLGINSQNSIYPDTISTPSGGSGGGTGGLGDFNADDFASSSESQSSSYGGPSDWSKAWTQNYLDRFQPGLNANYNQWNTLSNQAASPVGTLNAKQISDLLANLMNTRQQTGSDYTQMRNDNTTNTSGMRDWIEQARQLMPQQYSQEMNLYNQRATQPVLNNMSNRGILNSSVTSGALSDVLRDTQAKQSDLVNQSNLWAANKNYDLSQYLNDRTFDINKLQTGQNYDTNKYQTDKTYAANDTTGERQLAVEKEQRDALLKREQLYATMIPSLLNALHEQSSQSTGSSFGGLMDLLLASQGG